MTTAESSEQPPFTPREHPLSCVADEVVLDLTHLVDTYQLASVFDRFHCRDFLGPGGRPRKIPTRAIAIGYLLASYDRSLVCYTDVYDALWRRMSPAMQFALGIWQGHRLPAHGKRDERLLKCIYRYMKPVRAALDLSGYPKNRRLTKTDCEALRKELSAEERRGPVCGPNRVVWADRRAQYCLGRRRAARRLGRFRHSRCLIRQDLRSPNVGEGPQLIY